MISGDCWDSILALAGRDDLIGDPRYSTEEERNKRPEQVEAIIESWTRTRTKREVMATLVDLGVPCGAVQDTTEVLRDEHLRARGMVFDCDDPSRGSYPAIGNPIKIQSHQAAYGPPPLLGEHTQEVLAEWLGMSEGEIDGMKAKGVV
jgi:formyl-CoA transferase